MTVIIDLLGSWIIRASLITVMLTLTVTLNDTLYESNQQATAKMMIVAADSIIYSDLNMAGYYVADPTTTFYSIADTAVTFYGDINNGSMHIPETIQYFRTLDNTTGLYKLYRYVNNENGGNNLLLGSNFQRVKFLYYDNNGKPTTDKTKVVSVRVQLTTKINNSTSAAYSSITRPFYASTDFQVHPANL